MSVVWVLKMITGIILLAVECAQMMIPAQTREGEVENGPRLLELFVDVSYGRYECFALGGIEIGLDVRQRDMPDKGSCHADIQGAKMLVGIEAGAKIQDTAVGGFAVE